jgi:hypothetical protein
LRAVKLEAVVSIGFSYGDDDTHARRATEVQWWERPIAVSCRG